MGPGGAGTRLLEGGTAGLPRVTALTPDTSPVLPAARPQPAPEPHTVRAGPDRCEEGAGHRIAEQDNEVG